MTTRGQINSNFYQIVNVDGDGNPTDIKPQYITNIGNLTSLTVTGNITAGNLSTAGNVIASNLAGNLTGNVSGNVTGNVSGNLTGTTVSVTGNITGANLNGNLYGGNVSASNITANGTISSTGNVTAPFFIGNVVGNISGNFVVPGANTDVLFNNDGNAGASSAFTFNKDNNTLTLGGPLHADSFFGDGSGLYNITAANVTGLGNIVTVNLDGNAGNILYGNGVFSTAPNVSYANNANYANFAGEAFLVSGANVNGTVANANFATYSGTANIANVAYSVAGANVTGTVANANYATFAGTAYSVSGANVSGTVANANYATYSGTAYSVSGANVSGDVSGANHANIADVANSVSGSNVSGDVSGANHANVADVANSVSVGNVTGIGNIATINLDGSTSNVLYGNGTFAPIPTVSNVANANYANFAGTAYSVSGANVVGDVSGANHANIADVANSVSGSNVSGQVANALVAGTVYTNAQPNITSVGTLTSLSVSGNVTANYFIGNGSQLTDINGSNVSNVANANYANFAGNVVNSAQSNITSLGNLVSLTINNGVSGSATKQFNPNGISIGSTANTNLMANSSFVDIDYGNGQGDGNVLLGKTTTYLKARGSSGSMTTANVSDRVGRTNYLFYNGTSNVLAAATQVNPFAVFNSNANAVTTSGQYVIITGNPNGDQGNANALSNQNLYTFDPYGRITITQGAAGTTGAAININTYGAAAGGAAAGAQGVLFSRTRGNRDSNLSVQPSDQLGTVLFAGYNGTSLFSTRLAQIRGVVDSSYTANTTAIPAGLQFLTCDNTTSYTHNFYANGNVTFASGKTVSASYFSGDGGNLTGIGLSNTATGGQLTLNPTGAGAPFLTIAGNSASSNTGQFTLNDGTFTAIVNGDTFPGGASAFAFNTYQNANTPIAPQYYKRYHGNVTSPSGVSNGDEILRQYFQVYGDSGNTNMTLGGTTASVGTITSPGNISFSYNIYSSGNSNDLLQLSFPTANATGNFNVSGNLTAANVQVNNSGFMKLASYTKTALTAITGQIGWMAAVSDSASGGNPNGMIAFWDTTNSRWSYVHDNSAV